MKKILGLDLSLTETGYCVIQGNDILEKGVIKTKVKGMERLKQITDFIYTLIKEHGNIDIVSIEGYAMGVKGGRVFSIGELGGLVKMLVWKFCKNPNTNGTFTQTIIVPPKTLKKFITNNGNAGKDVMLLKTYRKYGIEFKNNNICDAFGLAKVGEAYINGTDITYEKECLEKVEVLV